MHVEGHQPMQSWIVLGNARLMMTSMQATYFDLSFLCNALLAAVFARNRAASNALL